MKLKVITATSKESSIEVNNSMFATKDNPTLLAQAIRIYLSNLRQGTSKVKTRSQVNRSKSKWYRQKGTGNARHGSRNAHIFVGGGVAHGPKGIENWNKNLNSKLQADQIFVTDNLNGLQGKTAEADLLLQKMLGKVDKILIVLGENSELIKRSVNNIGQVLTVNANELNALHLVTAKKIIFTKEALQILENRLKKETVVKSNKITKKIKPVEKIKSAESAKLVKATKTEKSTKSVKTKKTASTAPKTIVKSKKKIKTTTKTKAKSK